MAAPKLNAIIYCYEVDGAPVSVTWQPAGSIKTGLLNLPYAWKVTVGDPKKNIIFKTYLPPDPGMSIAYINKYKTQLL